MIPVRDSFLYEFIPVHTYRSVFVYMIPVKNLIPVQLVPVGDFTCKHPLRRRNSVVWGKEKMSHLVKIKRIQLIRVLLSSFVNQM